MANLSPAPKLQFFDANGNPLAGGKLYTYAAGTTTPLATYTDAGAGTPNANPIVLDSRGEANVWLGSASYKLKLTTSTDVEIWTVDNVSTSSYTVLTTLAASGGSNLIGFLQSGTGAAARTVQSKLRDVVSVKDFGAVGNGIADDTSAIQTALNYWVTNACDLIFPSGNTFLVTSPLVANFTTNSTTTKRILGYGATIAATTVSGNAFTIKVTGNLTLVRNIAVEGLLINGNTAANSAFVMQGPLAGDSYFYNNVIRNLSVNGFTGISLLGNFFESSVQDCYCTCPVSATSGYGIFIDTSGGSGTGSGGVISSLTLYQNSTRGGINGVYVSATSNDVNILNGTYLLAQQEGIYIGNAQGGYVKGAHVESNWQSNPGLVATQAGIRAIVGGTFTIENTFASRNTSGQTHAARVFVASGGCAILNSGVQFNGSQEFYVGGNADSRAIIHGSGTYATSGTIVVTQLNGLRTTTPIVSNVLTRTSGAGPFTPSTAQTVLHILLTSNPTINAPSFTPNYGDELEFIFEQSGSGGNTVTWDSVYLAGSFVPTSAYGKLSTIRFRYVSKFTSSNSNVWVPISTGTT